MPVEDYDSTIADDLEHAHQAKARNVRVRQEAIAGWQYVDTDTTRMRVPGGWLYKVYRPSIGAQPPATMVFVPDAP